VSRKNETSSSMSRKNETSSSMLEKERKFPSFRNPATAFYSNNLDPYSQIKGYRLKRRDRYLYSKESFLNDLQRLHDIERKIDIANQLGLSPNKYDYDYLLKCNIRIGNSPEVLRILEKMNEMGFSFDTNQLNDYIVAAIRINNMTIADKLIQHIKSTEYLRPLFKPNQFLYIALMEWYGKRSYWEEAVHVFRELKLKSSVPSVSAYNVLIDILARNNNISLALEIFNEMKLECPPNATTYCYLIAATGRDTRDPDKPVKLFEEMILNGIQPETSSYNSIIDACGKTYQMNKAFLYLQEMIDHGTEPDQVTFTILIAAYAKQAQPLQARKIFDRMTLEGMEPSVVSFTALITAYARANDISNAFTIFEEMIEQGIPPDVVTYSVMIWICRQIKDIDRALTYWKRMKQDGLLPSPGIYNQIIMACYEGNRTASVHSLLDEMVSIFVETTPTIGVSSATSVVTSVFSSPFAPSHYTPSAPSWREFNLSPPIIDPVLSTPTNFTPTSTA